VEGDVLWHLGYNFCVFLLNLLSYPRGILVTLFGLIHTALMSVFITALAASVRSRRIVDLAIIYIWSFPLIKTANVDVDVRGTENVKENGKGFLILFNHSSLMDIPILYAYFPRSFRFGAKIELFKIPFFGKAMELCGVLPIDRGNRNKVMQVYQNAISRVNKGEAFALAPEGTRQKQTSLGKFKRGPFEFAINAQMDIIPAVLAGVYDVLPRNGVLLNVGRWRRKVILEILPRVPTAGLAIEQVDALLENVRAQMDKVFVQANEELKGF
jgi:1-acyl-sn-glycerol-3-phosphate acyltransferase